MSEKLKGGVLIPKNSANDVISYGQQTKCQLDCNQLLNEFGTVIPRPDDMKTLSNQFDLKIMMAMDNHNLTEILDARRERNCFYKWRDKCLVDVADIEATRARIAKTTPLEKKM